jgi:hypothetical protein
MIARLQVRNPQLARREYTPGPSRALAQAALSNGALEFSNSVYNYSVAGELLTGLQNNSAAPEAYGRLYQIAPALEDAHAWPLTLHRIASVLHQYCMRLECQSNELAGLRHEQKGLY